MTEGVLHFLRDLASRATTPNGARLSEFMFIHLAILAIIVLVSVAVYTTITSATFGIGLIVGLLVLTLVCAFAASCFFQAAVFADQHGRDLTAHRIMSRVIKGRRSGAYGVLIRPFSNSDLVRSNALPAVPFGRLLSSGPVYAGPEKPMAMEHQLVRAMENSVGPLVTFGGPTYAPGAGRAPVSACDWEATAGEMADHASIIFFTPGIDNDSKQALSELLDTDLIRRTVIVEPGALDEPHSNDVEADSVIRWNSLRSMFAQHGYALPAKSEHGALIYFGVAGAEPHVISFGAWHTRHLKLFLDFVADNAVLARRELDARNAAATPKAEAPPVEEADADKDAEAA